MNTTGILLAAGASTRFGSDKRLLRLADGVTLLQHALGRLVAVVDDVVVVLRPGDEGLAGDIAGAGIRCRINPRAADGMGGSLACAVRASAEADGWLIMPVDLPLLRESTLLGVAQAMAVGRAVVPVCHGVRGHPVGLSRRFGTALAALNGEAGGRDVLRRHADAVTWLNVHDPGIHRDIDSPADLIRLRGRVASPTVR